MEEIFKQIMDMREKTRNLSWIYWHGHTVFTWQWWLLVLFIILPWVFICLFANRSMAKQLGLVVVMTSLICFMLDQAGTSVLLWTYPYTLTPLPREIFDPANWSILPFFFMMLYQLFATWRVYLAMSALFALFASFVGGWLFESTHNYVLLLWRNTYSVPVYFAIAVLIKAVVDWLDRIEKKEAAH